MRSSTYDCQNLYTFVKQDLGPVVLSQQIMSGFLYVTSPAAYLIRRLKHSCGTALRGAYHSTLNLIETCPFAMRMSLPSRLNRSIGRKIWFHVRS